MTQPGRRFGACLAIACLAAALAPVSARSEDGEPLTGTLRTIAQRGAILIGVRDASLPFSFRNGGGEPVGFSVDLCRGIAADVAAALNRPLLEPGDPSWQTGVRMSFIPVAADARLQKIASGEIDLECGSTTATAERAKTVAFSPVFFLAGTKLAVAADSPAESYRDLAGATVVAGAGTTNGAVMRRLAAGMKTPFTIVEAPTLPDAYDTLASGKAAAFASDDILLAGLLATRPDGRRFHVIGDYLSFEPYAIILRRDDPPFAALVRHSFERMAQEGLLHRTYARWFTSRLPDGETLGLPMSPQLAEMYRSLGEPD